MNHSSKCSLQKGGAKFEDQNQSDEKWPLWLPSEWLIHRDTNTRQQVYYSNPRGQAFYSEEEVIQHLSRKNQKRGKELATKKRTNRKNNEPKHEPEEAKVLAETTAATLPCLDDNDHPEWPAWLPHDWFIERDCENPSVVYYCSPKWKKFRTKDEVVQHVEAMSKKPATKPTRKKMKKIRESKDSSVN